jgi:tRNA A37 methylthiotransferase MiaB
MGRPKNARKVVERLKESVPGLTLRSTVITGFPGETEKDFREMADFVSEGWFGHLGVFEYSPAEGTPSSRLPGMPSPAAAAERKKELMLRQRKVVKENYAKLTGASVEILAEKRMASGSCYGRAYFQAPEIDGGVIIKGRCEPGQFVKAKVTGHKGYDLEAKI